MTGPPVKSPPSGTSPVIIHFNRSVTVKAFAASQNGTSSPVPVMPGGESGNGGSWYQPYESWSVPPRGLSIFISLATISVVYFSLPFWSVHFRVCSLPSI